MGTSIHVHLEYKQNQHDDWQMFKFNKYEKYGIWNSNYYPWLKFIGNISRVDTEEHAESIYLIEPFKTIVDISKNDDPFFYRLPDDVSLKVYWKYQKHQLDYHSIQTFTLEELQSFDYDKPLKILKIKNTAKVILNKISNNNVLTYRQWLGDSYFKFIRMLEKYKKTKNCQFIRIIIWFDN